MQPGSDENSISFPGELGLESLAPEHKTHKPVYRHVLFVERSRHIQWKHVNSVLLVIWKIQSHSTKTPQKKKSINCSRRKIDTAFLRMTLWLFHPVWRSMSPPFSVARFLHSQRNITLDPALVTYYHAVPLVSSRWHCIYTRCDVALWTMLLQPVWV